VESCTDVIAVITFAYCMYSSWLRI